MKVLDSFFTLNDHFILKIFLYPQDNLQCFFTLVWPQYQRLRALEWADGCPSMPGASESRRQWEQTSPLVWPSQAYPHHWETQIDDKLEAFHSLNTVYLIYWSTAHTHEANLKCMHMSHLKMLLNTESLTHAQSFWRSAFPIPLYGTKHSSTLVTEGSGTWSWLSTLYPPQRPLEAETVQTQSKM